MNDMYILDGHKPVVENDSIKWGKWFEKANDDRIVAKDTVGEVRISTVFLGLDHNFGQGLPLLFETMVFSGKLDGEQSRYSTWEEAEKGHKVMIEKVKGGTTNETV